MRYFRRLTALLACAIWLTGGANYPAMAHPHVWVTSKAEVVYEAGKIAAVQHHWTFDEFYTAMAIQGLDTNNDGIYSRQELSELAKVNMDGLKEFDFFTYARQGETKLTFGPPQDYWLEHANGILTLHFKLPLTAPLEAGAKGFQFAVYDPSAFIAFELAKGEPVTLAGAPQGCRVTVGKMEETPDEKSLTSAMQQQFGGGIGGAGTQSSVVTCGNS